MNYRQKIMRINNTEYDLEIAIPYFVYNKNRKYLYKGEEKVYEELKTLGYNNSGDKEDDEYHKLIIVRNLIVNDSNMSYILKDLNLLSKEAIYSEAGESLIIIPMELNILENFGESILDYGFKILNTPCGDNDEIYHMVYEGSVIRQFDEPPTEKNIYLI